MSKTQAVKLILENLSMIEEVSTFLDKELTPSLFNAIDSTIKDELGNWVGIFDFWENRTVFCPENFLTGELDKNLNYRNSIASYYFYQVDDTNYYWLSNLLNINGNLMKFAFLGHWGNENFNFTSGKWKKFCQQENEKYPEIQQAGFKFNEKEGEWYLPIQPLDIQKVIECYESDLEEAMEPIRDACRILLKTHRYFEEIMEDAKSYKG